MTEWLELSVQTRAYALIEAPEEARCLLLGFHGYAQRPAHCMAGLRMAGVDGAVLVAPMGQHHFYSRSGRVVASWMSKFHREHQVDQILDLARRLVAELELRFGVLPVYCMGFSQGASTAYRVGVMAGLDVRGIFPLAGDMPPELVESLGEWPPRPVAILYGEDDPQVPRTAMEADRSRLSAAGWPAELLAFPGGHEYIGAAMEAMGEWIAADLRR